MRSKHRILVDTWYASLFNDNSNSVNNLLQEKFPKVIFYLAERIRIVRGFLIFWIGRKYDLIITSNGQRGSEVLLFLEAWFGRKRMRVVMLEFIRKEQYKHCSPLFRLLYAIYFRIIRKPALQRGMRVGQVLTSWEQKYYASIYGVPRDRFYYIPWYQRLESDVFPGPKENNDLMVLSSGRAACDWDTLFMAAENRDWNLTIICGKKDLKYVNKLNYNRQAHILCDVSREEHQKYVESAAVYVICLREEYISAGHIRISNAIRGGTPIICTNVKAIDGYLTDKQNAILINNGDYLALREAIDELLRNPSYRKLLAKTAFERSVDYTREQYLKNIKHLVLDNTSIQGIS